MLNCVLNARLAGFPHQAGALQLLLFPSPGTKDCLPFGIDSLPPEQKVGGSNRSIIHHRRILPKSCKRLLRTFDQTWGCILRRFGIVPATQTEPARAASPPAQSWAADLRSGGAPSSASREWERPIGERCGQ